MDLFFELQDREWPRAIEVLWDVEFKTVQLSYRHQFWNSEFIVCLGEDKEILARHDGMSDESRMIGVKRDGSQIGHLQALFGESL